MDMQYNTPATAAKTDQDVSAAFELVKEALDNLQETVQTRLSREMIERAEFARTVSNYVNDLAGVAPAPAPSQAAATPRKRAQNGHNSRRLLAPMIVKILEERGEPMQFAALYDAMRARGFSPVGATATARKQVLSQALNLAKEEKLITRLDGAGWMLVNRRTIINGKALVVSS